MLKMLLLLILYLIFPASGLGPLPDASQESLLWQFRSYSNVALFHYSVPPEVTRATWEFASFHDKEGCNSRKVEIFIQHGSFPVFPVDNSSFPETFYLKRTHLDQLFVNSAYQPKNAAVYPVYNPLPGSWFVAAYLESFTEPLGFQLKCKYSLGSIALWNRADSVELILPNGGLQTFRTKKHFSYYKFFVPDDVDSFNLIISGCTVRLRQRPIGLHDDDCIEYVALRSKALPLHNPLIWSDDDETQQAFSNLTINRANVTFFEPRPVVNTYYYILVVTQGQVSFDLNLEFFGCGMSGLYGPGQNDWFLDERGLMYTDQLNQSHPKEPTTGFQLFASRPQPDAPELIKNFDLTDYTDEVPPSNISATTSKSQALVNGQGNGSRTCISTFDLTRMDSVTPFSVSYTFQGKTWYTKWVTVLERIPVFARFNIQELTDLGGSLNIKVTLDNFDDRNDVTGADDPIPADIIQEIVVCISKGRQPKLVETNSMSCDNRDSILVLTNTSIEALKVIPYPEPGLWYVGFQVRCSQNKSYIPCPFILRSAMVAVEIRIQPCGYRPMPDACGAHGVCATTTKGAFRFTNCLCFGGYRGWTCEDNQLVNESLLLAKTLFLILSNFSFLPAVVLAIYYRLFTEALIYAATMFFSIFYHTCDQQEASSHGLPVLLQDVCQSFYTTNEVLQFCDFYCAILSFWITIVSLARLPHKVVNFLNLFGVLLVAFLVQYNRTGAEVLFIPIILGLFVILISLGVKSYSRKRFFVPNRACVSLFAPAAFCAILAASLTAFLETTENYAFIHSVWHILMAAALLFLVPRCRDVEKSWSLENTPTEDTADGVSLSENSLASGSVAAIGMGDDCQIPSTESSSTNSFDASKNNDLEDATSKQTSVP